jgi:uncharacterized protein YegP (UPF0339 family)
MKLEAVVFKRADGLWDWYLEASNGEHIASSMQGYTERNDAVEALHGAFPDLEVRFEDD